MLSAVSLVERKRELPRPQLVRCPNCGTPRVVSGRHAAEVPVRCKSCPEEAERGRLSVRYRRYWLTRYTDEDIAWMASAVHGIPLNPEGVALQRRILLP